MSVVQDGNFKFLRTIMFGVMTKYVIKIDFTKISFTTYRLTVFTLFPLVSRYARNDICGKRKTISTNHQADDVS